MVGEGTCSTPSDSILRDCTQSQNLTRVNARERLQRSPGRQRHLDTTVHDESLPAPEAILWRVSEENGPVWAPGPWFAYTPTHDVPVLTARSTGNTPARLNTDGYSLVLVAKYHGRQ